ncbi:MAG: choice-of-anchor Q domain-containing protein, partial [Planctomycetota bacterium]
MVLSVLCCLITPYLAAQPYIVSTLADEDDGDHTHGDLSLREAIGLAAQNPGPDVISFDDDLFGTGMATIDMENGLGDLTLDSEVQIIGPGAEQLTVRVGNLTVDADTDISDLTLTSEADTSLFLRQALTLDHAELAGGIGITTTFDSSSGSGGGYGAPELFVRDSRLTNRTVAVGYAGVSSSPIRIERSVFEGTPLNSYLVTVTAIDSTFTGYSGTGAAIRIHLGRINLYNSTISGNTSTGNVAGLYVGYTTTGELINCTVTDNRADNEQDVPGAAGGIWAGIRYNPSNSSTLILSNTIVAGNTADAEGLPADLGGATSGSVTISGTHNLIGVDATGSFTDNVDDNRVGVTDPRLAPRVSGEGSHALLSDSLALDAGDNALAVGPDGQALTHDQRGEPRVQGRGVDIGASENYVFAADLLVDAETTTLEGATYTLGFSANGAPVTGWTIDWGDGLTDELPAEAETATHRYIDGDATYTVRVTAATESGPRSAPAFDLQVQNVPPTLRVNGPSSIGVGRNYELVLSASD